MGDTDRAAGMAIGTVKDTSFPTVPWHMSVHMFRTHVCIHVYAHVYMYVDTHDRARGEDPFVECKENL